MELLSSSDNDSEVSWEDDQSKKRNFAVVSDSSVSTSSPAYQIDINKRKKKSIEKEVMENKRKQQLLKEVEWLKSKGFFDST